MFSILFELGRVGWAPRTSGDLIPERRFGFLRVAWTRGYFVDALEKAAKRLRRERQDEDKCIQPQQPSPGQPNDP